MRALLEQHKRRILETRISNARWAELRRLRDVFLQYGLADKFQANRRFFDQWLTSAVVEMGWTPSGGWPLAQISDLRAHLEKVRA